jgi:hypothetical protein
VSALSPETLNFLAHLLSQVQIPASAADFDEQCAIVSKARKELISALAETEADASESNRAARRHPRKPST